MILSSTGNPDRSAMGFIQPKRIQVKLLDLALALTLPVGLFSEFQAEAWHDSPKI
jgi:hypothetical protein